MSGKAMQFVGGASSFLKKTLRKITRKMKGKKNTRRVRKVSRRKRKHSSKKYSA